MIPPFSFIFYKGNKKLSKLIIKITKGQYSHVGFMIDPIHIIQLDYKTPVSIQHFSYIDEEYDVYQLRTELTEEEQKKVVEFIKLRISTRYDFKLIMSRLLNQLFDTEIKGSHNKYNCDELLVDAFRSIGINLIEKDVVMTPDTLSKSKLLRKIERKEVENTI